MFYVKLCHVNQSNYEQDRSPGYMLICKATLQSPFDGTLNCMLLISWQVRVIQGRVGIELDPWPTIGGNLRLSMYMTQWYMSRYSDTHKLLSACKNGVSIYNRYRVCFLFLNIQTDKCNDFKLIASSVISLNCELKNDNNK